MNDILQYKGYYASLHFSSEDEVFFGKILGIDDLVNFEGASVKELKKAFREAVDDYLETCEALGKEPNKTYKGSFNVRIPTDLHKEAAIFASINNISLNDFIRTAIDYALLHRDDVSRLNKKSA
ncbi:MAG: type II toxin-antitoxin system HicB family antitoxin [Bacteroidetes bacterium]|nr:type II toxin-antitoxin system HicB family antitoxin [Bacteroidota bacterium]